MGGRAGEGEANSQAVYGKSSWAGGTAGARLKMWLEGSCAGGTPDERGERAGEGRGSGRAGERGSMRGRAVVHACGRAANPPRLRLPSPAATTSPPLFSPPSHDAAVTTFANHNRLDPQATAEPRSADPGVAALVMARGPHRQCPQPSHCYHFALPRR